MLTLLRFGRALSCRLAPTARGYLLGRDGRRLVVTPGCPLIWR